MDNHIWRKPSMVAFLGHGQRLGLAVHFGQGCPFIISHGGENAKGKNES